MHSYEAAAFAWNRSSEAVLVYRSVVALTRRLGTEGPAPETEADPEGDAPRQTQPRPEDGVDSGYRRRPFDDDHVRSKGVVEAGERLTCGVAPVGPEASRLLDVPSLVSALRQGTLGLTKTTRSQSPLVTTTMTQNSIEKVIASNPMHLPHPTHTPSQPRRR